MGDGASSAVVIVRLACSVALASGALLSLYAAAAPFIRRGARNSRSFAESGIVFAGAIAWAALAVVALPSTAPKSSDDASESTEALEVAVDDVELDRRVELAVERYVAKLASRTFRKLRAELRAPGLANDARDHGARYIVQPEDSLFSIAERSYGDGRLWSRIYEANPWLDPDRLRAGDLIMIPRVVEPGGSDVSNP